MRLIKHLLLEELDDSWVTEAFHKLRGQALGASSGSLAVDACKPCSARMNASVIYREEVPGKTGAVAMNRISQGVRK